MTVALKKNIAGFRDASGVFHPIRSPQYVGSRRATGKDRRQYSRAKAGDLGPAKQERALEDVFDREIRLQREAAAGEKQANERLQRQFENEAFGDADSSGKGQTLLQFVRGNGGIRRTYRFGGKKGAGKYGTKSSWDKGEIDRLSHKQTGKRGLTTDDRNKGKTMDGMYQAALAAGYDVSSIDDLMARIEDEAGGGSPTYATHGFMDYTKQNPKLSAIRKKTQIGGKAYWVVSDGERIAAGRPGQSKATVVAHWQYLHGTKQNPAAKKAVDWGMRVCANCDKYVANGELKKLGAINVCKPCHKTLTARTAAKNQRSLFDDQGNLFNPGLTWSTNAHQHFLLYQGRILVTVSKNNASSFEIFDRHLDKSHYAKTLTMAKQKALQIGRAQIGGLKEKVRTDAEILAVVNKHGNKTLLRKHGKAVRIEPAAFSSDKWIVTLADGLKVETRIPKRNPDAISMFAALAGGLASTLSIKEHMERPKRKTPAKRRGTTKAKRRNPVGSGSKAAAVKKNPHSALRNPHSNRLPKGDVYVLTIKRGDDVESVYLHDGNADGFSKRFRTMTAAKGFATKNKVRVKSNPPAKINGILKRFIAAQKNPIRVKLHKFYVGQKLATRAIGDYDIIYRGEVISRTPKFVTLKVEGDRDLKRCGISRWEDTEVIYPHGRHSMASTFRAKDGAKVNPATKKAAAKKANPSTYTNKYYQCAECKHPANWHVTRTGECQIKNCECNGYRPVYGQTKANPVGVLPKGCTVAKDHYGRWAVRYPELYGRNIIGLGDTRKAAIADARSTLAHTKRGVVHFKKTGLHRKRNPQTPPRRRTFEKFQGRRVENVRPLPISHHAGTRPNVDQLGRLHEIKLMNGQVLKFNPSRAVLVAKNGRMWIAGQKVAKADARQARNVLNPIDHVDHVVYETHKPHHGDAPGTHYIHKLGEEGGTLPLFCVDNDGFAVLKGGTYKIQAEGIRD